MKTLLTTIVLFFTQCAQAEIVVRGALQGEIDASKALNALVQIGNSLGGPSATELRIDGPSATTVTADYSFASGVPVQFELRDDGVGNTTLIIGTGGGAVSTPVFNRGQASSGDWVFRLQASSAQTTINLTNMTYDGQAIADMSLTGPNQVVNFFASGFGDPTGNSLIGTIEFRKDGIFTPVGANLSLTISQIAVPEPGTTVLMVAGSLLFLHRKRRRW